jgi:hypothetical protein
MSVSTWTGVEIGVPDRDGAEREHAILDDREEADADGVVGEHVAQAGQDVLGAVAGAGRVAVGDGVERDREDLILRDGAGHRDFRAAKLGGILAGSRAGEREA